jgi:16S rRNA processing protein RimM
MKLIAIGRIAGAFGVGGEVRVTPYGEDPVALVRYRELRDASGKVVLTLEGGRAHKGALVARAREIDSKEAADALRGRELFAPREAFAPPEDEDEFYLADLIGLRAVHPDGRALGVVKAVQNFGAGDLLEIDPEDGTSFFLPFTRAAVPEVRIAEGVLIAEPPDEVD